MGSNGYPVFYALKRNRVLMIIGFSMRQILPGRFGRRKAKAFQKVSTQPLKASVEFWCKC